MARKISIQNQEFTEFLNENIDRNDYRYTYLVQMLDLIFDRRAPIDTKSHFLIDDGRWLLFIDVQSQLFIYGCNINNELIDAFNNEVDFKTYSNIEIMGDYDLVCKILKKNEIEEYELIKDRIFYKITSINAISENNMVRPETEDYSTLIDLFEKYYNEEYEGKRNKKYGELKDQVNYLISRNNLYLYKKEGNIKGFCSINDPDIGIVFVKKECRNQGISKKMLNFCTSKLLQYNDEVYLMTDRNNEVSNKMCTSIGYIKYYEHTNIRLN